MGTEKQLNIKVMTPKHSLTPISTAFKARIPAPKAIQELLDSHTELEREVVHLREENKLKAKVLIGKLEEHNLDKANKILSDALRQFASCDLTPENCASVELATRRIRNLANMTLKKAEEAQATRKGRKK